MKNLTITGVKKTNHEVSNYVIFVIFLLFSLISIKYPSQHNVYISPKEYTKREKENRDERRGVRTQKDDEERGKEGVRRGEKTDQV